MESGSKDTLVFTLTQDKVTKGAIRYSDSNGHSIYFRKDEIPSTFGEMIEVTVKSK